MSLRGSAETISLVDLLTIIQANGHAGTLKIRVGERAFKLFFFKGEIYLPTGGARGNYKVGALLVRAKKITGKDLLRALQLQEQVGQRERLGEVLIREGLASRESIDQVVRKQFEEEIFDLLFEEQAYFEFKKDVLPAGFFSDATGTIEAERFDTRSVLMEASRRQDEWKRIRSRIPSMKAVYVVGAHTPDGASPPSEDESFDVPAPERADPRAVAAVMDALRQAGAADLEACPFDGERSIDEVVAATGASTFEALGAIARLRERGLVRPLSMTQIEARARVAMATPGRARQAFKLYEWANDVERLHALASKLDKELLLPEVLSTGGRPAFAGRTSGRRALEVLSRLLRRGAPFAYHAREEGCAIDVYLVARSKRTGGTEGAESSLRLHLQGPRRTLSATRYLRSRGVLTATDLKLAREISRQSGRELDRVLVEDRFVTRRDWVVAVKDKIVSGMFSLFEWSEPYIEVTAGEPPPAAEESAGGLVCEVPLDAELREELRKDLLGWKAALKVVPSSDAIFVCAKPTPANEPRRAHDLCDGRRAVQDLMQLARTAPLELVRFLLEALLDQRIRRLTEREHDERLQRAVAQGRHDDAVAYAKSAISFGFEADRYRQRLGELREKMKDAPRSEGRPTVAGELGSVSLADVLQLLHRGKRTGTLKIRDGDREKALYLDRGEVFVLKLDGQPNSDVQAWLGESSIDSVNLDELLRQRGLVEESEVDKKGLEKIKEEIVETFLNDAARFEFLQNLLPTEVRADAPGTARLALKTEQLLFEAMRRSAEWDELRATLRSARAVFRFASEAARRGAEQDEQNGAIARLFDGNRTLSDIVRDSREGRFRVYRVAKDLVDQNGLVFVRLSEKTSMMKARASGSDEAPPLASGRVQRIRADELPPPSLGDLLGASPPRGDEVDDSITELDAHEKKKSSSGSHRSLAPKNDPSSSSRRWGAPPPRNDAFANTIGEDDDDPPPPPPEKKSKPSSDPSSSRTRRWGAPPS